MASVKSDHRNKWARAIAPRATILLVETPSNGLSSLLNEVPVPVAMYIGGLVGGRF